MRTILRYVLFMLIAGVVVPWSMVHADPISDLNSRPEVYVQDIHLDKTTHASGDTVMGTFILWNDKPIDAPNVYYTVSLAGDYQKNTLASTFYDTSKPQGPVYVAGNEKKTVTFSYTLPQGVTGKKLGIQVRAFLESGAPMGWGDTFLTVTGEQSFATIKSAFVTVGKDNFNLQAGPTLSTTTENFLTVTLTNPGATPLTLTPVFNVYNMVVLGAPLNTYKTDSFTIEPKGTHTIKIPLPTEHNTPKVYVGDLHFVDSKNVDRAPALQVHYVVPGDIVTIQNISTDKQTVTEGDAVTVNLMYSGTPFDVTTGKVVGSGKANLSLTLYNEQDQLVGTYTGSDDFSTGILKQIPIIAQIRADALRVDATINKDGKIFSHYSVKLSAQYDEKKEEATQRKQKILIVEIVGGLAILILIIACVLWWRKKGTPTIGVTIFLLLLVGVGMMLPAGRVGAFNLLQYSGTYPPFVNQVNSPASSYLPGQTFNLTGNFYYSGVYPTTNSDFDLNIYVTASWDSRQNQVVNNSYIHSNSGAATSPIRPGGPILFAIPQYSSGGVLTSNGNGFGTFVAPSVPGSYYLEIKFEVCSRDGMSPVCSYTRGQQPFTVILPPTVTLTATPNPVSYNNFTTLLWTSTNAKACWSSDFSVPYGSPQNTSTDSVPGVLTTVTSSRSYTIHCGPNSYQDPAVASLEAVSTVTVALGPSPSVQGYIDGADCNTITGWVCQAYTNNNWNAYINIFPYVDGSSSAFSKTLPQYRTGNPPVPPYNNDYYSWGSTYRQDLVNAGVCGGTGYHGFSIPTPNILKDGQVHTLSIYGQDLYLNNQPAAGNGPLAPLTYSPMTKVFCSSLAPTVTLTATPNPVNYNTATTLTWATSDPLSVCWSNDFNVRDSASGVNFVYHGSNSSGPLTATKTFSVNCGRTQGVPPYTTANVTVGVTLPPPTVSLSARPTVINYTDSHDVTLTSTISNASSCTLYWSGPVGISGSQLISPVSSDTVVPNLNIAGTYTFSVGCINAQNVGTNSNNAVVVVNPPVPPTVFISASPTTITSGQSTTLTSTISNATSCTLYWSGATTGSQLTSSVSSSLQIPNLSVGTHTFSVGCINGSDTNGTNSNNVSVVVNPAPPTVKLVATSPISYNTNALLSWGTTGATSCILTWPDGKTTSYSGSGGSINRTGSDGVSAGPLTALSSIFSMTCTGPGGTSTPSVATVTIPPPPTDLLSVCASDKSANTMLSWNNQGQPKSYLRIEDTSNWWGDLALGDQGCSNARTDGGYCNNGTTDLNPNSPFPFTTTKDHTYQWWVHTEADNGAYSDAKHGDDFMCPVPFPIYPRSICPAPGDVATFMWDKSSNLYNTFYVQAWDNARGSTGCKGVGNGSDFCADVTGTSTQFVGTTPNATYHWNVWTKVNDVLSKPVAENGSTVTCGKSNDVDAHLSVNQSSLVVNKDTTRLNWSSVNATSCTGDWVGHLATIAGNQNIGPLSAAQTYNLSCTDGSTNTTDHIKHIATSTVTVSITNTPPPKNCSDLPKSEIVAPTSVPSGGTFHIFCDYGVTNSTNLVSANFDQPDAGCVPDDAGPVGTKYKFNCAAVKTDVDLLHYQGSCNISISTAINCPLLSTIKVNAGTCPSGGCGVCTSGCGPSIGDPCEAFGICPSTLPPRTTFSVICPKGTSKPVFFSSKDPNTPLDSAQTNCQSVVVAPPDQDHIHFSCTAPSVPDTYSVYCDLNHLGPLRVISPVFKPF